MKGYWKPYLIAGAVLVALYFVIPLGLWLGLAFFWALRPAGVVLTRLTRNVPDPW